MRSDGRVSPSGRGRRALSPKAEEFCRLVAIERLPKAEAYRRAYLRPALSPAAANKAAFRLLKDDRVGAKIEQLKLMADDAAVLRKEQLMERVLDTAESADRAADKLKGYDLYAKLAGFYDASVVQVNVGVCTTFEALMHEIELSQNDGGSGA